MLHIIRCTADLKMLGEPISKNTKPRVFLIDVIMKYKLARVLIGGVERSDLDCSSFKSVNVTLKANAYFVFKVGYRAQPSPTATPRPEN